MVLNHALPTGEPIGIADLDVAGQLGAVAVVGAASVEVTLLDAGQLLA